jgi:Uma2 family endonuclease
MSSTALVSVEEYLNRSDKPSCEYLEGTLHPKPMPTKLHALVQFLLVTLLRKQNIEALAEVTVRLSERRFLVPDVIAAPACLPLSSRIS